MPTLALPAIADARIAKDVAPPPNAGGDRAAHPEIGPSPWPFRLLAAFAGWMWLQTAWAVSPNHTDGAVLFTKYAILCLILTKLLRTEHDIEFFAWMHVIGCFIWGWTAYTSNFGGRLEIVLGPGVDDSNLLGGHLVTGVAFAGFLFLGSTGLRRWVALGVLPFILNGIIMTASRSALVALVMAGAASLVIGPRGKRLAITLSNPWWACHVAPPPNGRRLFKRPATSAAVCE